MTEKLQIMKMLKSGKIQMFKKLKNNYEKALLQMYRLWKSCGNMNL